MWSGLLPVGSVVLLEESEKRVMITGYIQASVSDEGKIIYDYCGCLFPEGYMDAEHMYLFNHDQIQTVFCVGYMDGEEMEFIHRAEEILAQLRMQEAGEAAPEEGPVS